MTNALLRKLVKWFGWIIVAHILAMIIFGMVFSGTVASMSLEEESFAAANMIVLWFDVAYIAIFFACITKFENSFLETRRLFKQNIKTDIHEGGMSEWDFFKKHYLKEHIWRIVIYAVFQLPFLVFYLAWGLDLVYTTGFEKFYIMSAGTYATTRVGILGYLLNVVTFAALLTGIQTLAFILNKRKAERDMVF